MKANMKIIIKLKNQLAENLAQSTAEYALVILGAATLGTIFIAWVSDTNRIGKLFDAILRSVVGLI